MEQTLPSDRSPSQADSHWHARDSPGTIDFTESRRPHAMCRAGDGHSGKVMIMSSEDLTRRGFVGAVGVTAGAASVLGAPAIGRVASANEKIRLGIIGAGSHGGQLLCS